MRLRAMKKQSQNKPNSNPIPQKPKMNVNSIVTKDYENRPPFGLQENKPNLAEDSCKDQIIDYRALAMFAESWLMK